MKRKCIQVQVQGTIHLVENLSLNLYARGLRGAIDVCLEI
jgi:hypothetical protein